MPSSLDPRSQGETVRANRQTPVYNAQGGVKLIDDGTGRLRNPTKADLHPDTCVCHFCRRVCCIHCHAASPTSNQANKIWVGLPGFGRHVTKMHPEAYAFSQTTLEKDVARLLAQRRLARELKRVDSVGLRKVPLRRITPEVVKALHQEVQQARGALRRGSRDPLFLAAIETADASLRPNLNRDIERQVRALAFEVERAEKTNTPTTVTRETYYDPRVAAEILKLSYGLSKSWSFIVHLLCVYGITALVEQLAQEGVIPPTYIPTVQRPRDILKDEALRGVKSSILGENLTGAAKRSHEAKVRKLTLQDSPDHESYQESDT